MNEKLRRRLLLAALLSALVPVAAAQAPAPPPELLPKPSTACFHQSPKGEEEIGYCHALRVGDTLYISGTVGKGPMEQAVATVYTNLQATLRQHGLNFSHVVKENVYATDLDAFIGANAVRKPFYAGAQPAATWVQVARLVRPEYVLEVELVAKIPQ